MKQKEKFEMLKKSFLDADLINDTNYFAVQLAKLDKEQHHREMLLQTQPLDYKLRRKKGSRKESKSQKSEDIQRTYQEMNLDQVETEIEKCVLLH